jgi:hypothetical protein
MNEAEEVAVRGGGDEDELEGESEEEEELKEEEEAEEEELEWGILYEDEEDEGLASFRSTTKSTKEAMVLSDDNGSEAK